MTTAPSQFFLQPSLDDEDDDDNNGDDGDIELNTSASRSSGDVDDFLRKTRAIARDRLRTRIKLLHREISKPLGEIICGHVLHRLPASSLLRLRAVARSWAGVVASPIFAHTQSHTYRSISGVFFRSSSVTSTAYAPFPPAAAHSLPYPGLSFLPAYPVVVLSSSNGLLLCHAPLTGTFFICNPVTAAWTAIPDPPRDPINDPAAVLINLPGVYNFRPDFTVVMVFKVPFIGSDIYGFQIFSSTAGGWWISNELCMERPLPDSGVAAGGVAYWLTSTSSMVRYDPAADKVSYAFLPMLHAARAERSIGEMGCSGRLYCVIVTPEALQVHRFLRESNEWALVESLDVIDTGRSIFEVVDQVDEDEEQEEKEGETWEVKADEDVEQEEKEGEAWEVKAGGQQVFKKQPWPLTFQGGDMEILLLVAGKVVSINLASKRVRVVATTGGFKYVPYTSTLAAVLDVTATTSTSSDGRSKEATSTDRATGGEE
ncbi:hypothetical protein Cni_G15230 [Canna indica]|uniref:F-box protein At3g26010-like beta-propeller domain-containing protein n=1 Tax=Canna indica TaxID=4628 RepID=A0AAQ3QEK2_9LILI|nr:hypothetical protein Cni_G15230 [Canna indica]